MLMTMNEKIKEFLADKQRVCMRKTRFTLQLEGYYSEDSFNPDILVLHEEDPYEGNNYVECFVHNGIGMLESSLNAVENGVGFWFEYSLGGGTSGMLKEHGLLMDYLFMRTNEGQRFLIEASPCEVSRKDSNSRLMRKIRVAQKAV